MDQFYSEAFPQNEPQPSGVYYKPGRGNTSRRQQKRQLLLTFINHAATPKPKNKTAPIKPTLLSTLLAILLE